MYVWKPKLEVTWLSRRKLIGTLINQGNLAWQMYKISLALHRQGLLLQNPAKQGVRAIPLCLPNNFKWDSKTLQCFRTGEKRSSLYVVDEALEWLRKEKGIYLFNDWKKKLFGITLQTAELQYGYHPQANLPLPISKNSTKKSNVDKGTLTDDDQNFAVSRLFLLIYICKFEFGGPCIYGSEGL